MRRLLLALIFLGTGCHAGAAPEDPFDRAMQDAAQGRHAAAAAGFHALALQGEPAAAHNLSILFALGQGVPRNTAEAAYWALRALLDGLEQAAPLADLLLADLPVAERARLADRLEAGLSPAAADGDAGAMLGLAVVLALIRPEPDLLTAHAWQSIAAALDRPGALQAREVTLSRMTPEDRVRAQAHALDAFAAWCASQVPPGLASCGVITPGVQSGNAQR